MKNLLTTTLVLSLAMLTTNSIVAAEREPRWRKPEWCVRAYLGDDKVCSVAYSKDGKNLITKAYDFPNPTITTKWDPVTLTPIKTRDTDNCYREEWGVIFDEKGNVHDYCHNAVLTAAAEVISASIPGGDNIKNTIRAATFSSSGKQLVTVFENGAIMPIIWERISQNEQATPALESKTTE